MPQKLRSPPEAVIRGQALADRVRGRDMLYKARNYMGPVHVDEASCSYRWFRLKMTTRPWDEAVRPRALDWMVSPAEVKETPSRITIRAYDMVGMLILDPRRIEDIESLRRGGATLDQLLRAFNYGRLASSSAGEEHP